MMLCQSLQRITFSGMSALTRSFCFVAGMTEAPRAEGGGERVVAERRWRLAMQSQAHPSSIMRDLLACLQLNQVSWKKQAPYNLKCRKAIGIAGRWRCTVSPAPPASCT